MAQLGYDMQGRINLTTYESDDFVDLYDTASLLKNKKLPTFKGLSSLWLLKAIEEGRVQSVIDFGCGAGAFYHAAKSLNPNIRYFGIDASEKQIDRAKKDLAITCLSRCFSKTLIIQN